MQIRIPHERRRLGLVLFGVGVAWFAAAWGAPIVIPDVLSPKHWAWIGAGGWIVGFIGGVLFLIDLLSGLWQRPPR